MTSSLTENRRQGDGFLLEDLTFLRKFDIIIIRNISEGGFKLTTKIIEEITREWEGRKITEEELNKKGWRDTGVMFDKFKIFEEEEGDGRLHYYPPTKTIEFVFLY